MNDKLVPMASPDTWVRVGARRNLHGDSSRAEHWDAGPLDLWFMGTNWALDILEDKSKAVQVICCLRHKARCHYS